MLTPTPNRPKDRNASPLGPIFDGLGLPSFRRAAAVTTMLGLLSGLPEGMAQPSAREATNSAKKESRSRIGLPLVNSEVSLVRSILDEIESGRTDKQSTRDLGHLSKLVCHDLNWRGAEIVKGEVLISVSRIHSRRMSHGPDTILSGKNVTFVANGQRFSDPFLTDSKGRPISGERRKEIERVRGTDFLFGDPALISEMQQSAKEFKLLRETDTRPSRGIYFRKTVGDAIARQSESGAPATVLLWGHSHDGFFPFCGERYDDPDLGISASQLAQALLRSEASLRRGANRDLPPAVVVGNTCESGYFVECAARELEKSDVCVNLLFIARGEGKRAIEEPFTAAPNRFSSMLFGTSEAKPSDTVGHYIRRLQSSDSETAERPVIISVTRNGDGKFDLCRIY